MGQAARPKKQNKKKKLPPLKNGRPIFIFIFCLAPPPLCLRPTVSTPPLEAVNCSRSRMEGWGRQPGQKNKKKKKKSAPPEKWEANFFFFGLAPPPLMTPANNIHPSPLARAVESRELEPFMFGTRPGDKTCESPKCRSA